MTRNDTCEDAAVDECMQLQQEQQQQQQELVADSQQLKNNNDKKTTKNKLRKKHPVYSNLRKAAKKSCDAAKESVKDNTLKVQDKRDNIVEDDQQEQQQLNEFRTSNSKEVAKLNDIPDSWELLYDLNNLPEKWTMEGILAQNSVASVESLKAANASAAATASTDHVVKSESDCQQTEEESSWTYDGDSKESNDSSEQSVEEFDKKMAKQKLVDISSTPSENISMHFLLRPQQLKESTSGSLRCSLTIMTDELHSQKLKSTTSIELTSHLDISMQTAEYDDDMVENLVSGTSVNAVAFEQQQSLSNEVADKTPVLEVVEVPNTLKIVGKQKNTYSECSTQWEGIEDSASTSNDVETVNWSCELHSNEENEHVQHDCDDPYKNWMERPRRGTLRAVRYKTEMCRTYEEGLPCTYGVRCQFAHGFHELRFQPRHPKHKTELCHMFHSMGICRYGRRCSFVHTENPSLLPQMHFNQQQQQQPQQQPQQQQQHHHHQRMYMNENRYSDFSGLAISFDKAHSTLQSSCHAQDSVFKNSSDNESANYYDVNNINGGEMETGFESTSNHLASNAITNPVQLQSGPHLMEESQLQHMENAVVPSMHQETISEGFSTPATFADNSLRHTDQKMVCFINGALPPVPWTNAVLYVPYEACSFHNTEQGQLLQPNQLNLRYYNNNSNCTFYGNQQLAPHLQPLPQRMFAPPQQAVAAFQASNGIVYFHNALQIAPNALAATTTTMSTATAAAAATATATAIVNNVPLYATPFPCPAVAAAAAAAEPQQIFQQSSHMPGNYYATAVQPSLGNHVNKYFQVVPHLGAMPYGNVYYVAASAAAAGPTNHPTAAYGNYAYTTNV